MLGDAIKWVRASHERLIYVHALGYRDELRNDSSVASTPHLDRLLELAERCLTAGPSRRRLAGDPATEALGEDRVPARDRQLAADLVRYLSERSRDVSKTRSPERDRC